MTKRTIKNDVLVGNGGGGKGSVSGNLIKQLRVGPRSFISSFSNEKGDSVTMTRFFKDDDKHKYTLFSTEEMRKTAYALLVQADLLDERHASGETTDSSVESVESLKAMLK